MTNLSSLPGFGATSGGGGAADLPAAFTDQPTLITSRSDNLRGNSSYGNISSPTYQSFHMLSSDGCFGGLFDPYISNSSSGGVLPVGFYVNPSNGSLTSLNIGSLIYSHSTGATFSTCHHGAVGMMVMNIGHHENPSYGSTNKGTIYGAGFNNSAVPTSGTYAMAPENMWPHSNGDLAVGCNSTTGTMYGRRSTYNSNDSRYWHSSGYFTHSGSASYSEYSNISSSTSTNYVNAAVRNSKGDLTPGGLIMYYNSSGVGKMTPVYGSSVARGTEYTAGTYGDFGNSWLGLRMSTGNTLWYHNGKHFTTNSSGAISTLSTPPEGIGFLSLINNGGNYNHTVIPCTAANTWIASTSGYGLIRFSVDPSNNYRVTVHKVFNSIAWLYSNSISHSGVNLGLVGANDEYLVYSKVSGGSVDRAVYENPLTA